MFLPSRFIVPKPDGSWDNPGKECLLEEADANHILVFGASTTEFDTNMPSGGCSTGMAMGGI